MSRKHVLWMPAVAALWGAVAWPGTAVGESRQEIRGEFVEPLSFGRWVGQQSTAQIDVSPRGDLLSSGDAAGMRGVVQPAVLRLQGAPGTSYRLGLPNTVELVGPTGVLRVDDLRAVPHDGGTFDGDGNAIVVIGGTLSAGDRDAGGVYRGILDVWVEYE